jgi:hypothetical protein
MACSNACKYKLGWLLHSCTITITVTIGQTQGSCCKESPLAAIMA